MSPPDGKRIQRTLRYSILDGMGYSLMVGAGETYFVPYALFLGASNTVVGLFVALPIFAGSFAQLLTRPLLARFGTRKRVILFGVALQAAAFLPMLPVGAMSGPWRGELLLALVCLYWAAGLLVGPSWSSLLGDLVPEAERGRYFGLRSRYVQITTFVGLVAGGAILYAFKSAGQEHMGFVATLLFAFGSRVASMVFLALHWEPEVKSPPPSRSAQALLGPLKSPGQRWLILYVTSMNLGVYLSAPFFSAYMLRSPEQMGLGWSYVTFTLMTGITAIFKFVFLPLWGGASDRFGSRKCLVLSAWMVSVLPILWVFPSDNAELYFGIVCVIQTLGGFAWAGHELCSFNFLLDSATPEDRPELVAAMNLVNGGMVFLGAILGALVTAAAPAETNPFLLVFIVSGVTRLVVCAAFLPRLKEVRVVERISYHSLFFRVSSIRANIGPVLRFFVLPNRRRPRAPEDGVDRSRGATAAAE